MKELLQAISLDFEAWTAGFGPLVMGQTARSQDVLEFVRVLRELDPVVTATCFRAIFQGIAGR
ncbi:MAG: hypothetical protein QUV07_11880 [Cyanobium sp. CZS 25K]|nr:hypothetical protein [Cyanobium sp. CZS25K]